MDEEALLAKRLQASMESAEIAWWEMRLPSGEINFGANKATLLGYDPKDFTHYSDFTKLVDPADYEPMMKSMRDHMDGKKEYYEALFRIKAADGSYLIYYDRGRITQRDENSTIISGMTTNVTAVAAFVNQAANQLAQEIS